MKFQKNKGFLGEIQRKLQFFGKYHSFSMKGKDRGIYRVFLMKSRNLSTLQRK